MKNTKKSTISATALAVALLGVGSAGAWADQLAQQPPAPPPPGAAPPAGAPPAPGQAAAAPAPAAPAAPTSPLIGPSITGPLTIQLPPPKYTLGPLGDVYVDGIGSGLGMWQNNPFPGNRSWQPDLSNGQLFAQKTDGIFQFYAQAGAYSIASLGSTYLSASTATFGYHAPAIANVPLNGDLWGWFPVDTQKLPQSTICRSWVASSRP